jgi:hypothetical protein
MRQLLSRPARTIAGATMAAILTGIVVNALVLQKAHRPPAAIVTSKSSTASAQPIAAAPAATSSTAVEVQPPTRPVDLSAPLDATPASPTRSGDPIRDLLRGDAGRGDAAHLTMTAQSALIKLGFSLKADGVVGASTEQAILQFERTHGLPQSNEITPKLVKQLSAAANAAAH